MEGCAAGYSGLARVQDISTSARSKGLHGNKGKFVAERVKSRPVACRPLCLKRSLPAPTKQEQMVHCFKGFSETKGQDQITFPQRGYLQKAFALIKDSSLFSSQHFIHNIGFWGGGEASIVYCASPYPPPGTRRASQTIGQQGRCLKCFTLSERQPIYLLLITKGLNSARPSHPLFTTETTGAATSCLCQEKPSPSLSICRSCQPKAGLGSSTPTTALLLHRRHRTVVVDTMWV